MTRYRITQRAGMWCIDRFDYDTAKWQTLPRQYDAATAELAGRTVDAMVAIEKNKETVDVP